MTTSTRLCNAHHLDSSLTISSRVDRLALPQPHSSSWFIRSPLCWKPTILCDAAASRQVLEDWATRLRLQLACKLLSRPQSLSRFGGVVSDLIGITASIIQGSAAGPASYVVTGSDLRPLTPGNLMVKFADDTYLVIPASNSGSCVEEVNPIGDWASSNNLRLNHASRPRLFRTTKMSTSCSGTCTGGSRHSKGRTHQGVRRDSQQEIIGGPALRPTSCILCAVNVALRTLRHHGLPTDALHTVFHATVVSKLSYAYPAWWGITSAADRDRLEAFLRRSATAGFRSIAVPTLRIICLEADDKLFAKITSNSYHLLHHLLPSRRDTHYSLRLRAHDFSQPTRTILH